MPQPASVLPTAVATILVVAAAWAAARTPPLSRDVAPTLGRAWAAYLAGDFQTALAAYHAAAEAAPRAVTPLLGVMYCESARGDAGAALTAARAVLARDPANEHAHRHLALTAYDTGDFAAAEHACRDRLATHPEDVEATALLGWCILRQARVAEARGHFQTVLAVVPHHASAAAGLAAADGAGTPADEGVSP